MEKPKSEEKGASLNPLFFGSDWYPENIEEIDESIPITDQEFQDFEWVWEGVLHRGGTSLLGGKPKVGKSTFAYHLMNAVASGTKFLGRSVMQGRVLYVKLEGDPNNPRKILRQLSHGRSLPIFMTDFRSKSMWEGVKKLHEKIIEHQPILVVVDTFWKLLRIQETGDYAEAASAIERIEHTAKELGCNILMIHHERKAQSGGISDVLGAVSITGGIDSIILLKKYGEDRVIESEQRYGEPLNKIPYIITNSGLQRCEFARGLKAEILRELGKEKEEVNTKMVLDSLGHGQKRTILRALNDLWDSGLVLRQGTGKPKDPYLWRKME
jgi:RecA-family ATPase